MFIFGGAFIAQWGIGFCLDTVTSLGVPRNTAFAWTLIGLAVLQMASLLWFLRGQKSA
jgi:hypothetical protein